jgi:hypothetical protein
MAMELTEGQEEELMEEPMESRYGWRMELQTDKKQITRSKTTTAHYYQNQ